MTEWFLFSSKFQVLLQFWPSITAGRVYSYLETSSLQILILTQPHWLRTMRLSALQLREIAEDIFLKCECFYSILHCKELPFIRAPSSNPFKKIGCQKLLYFPPSLISVCIFFTTLAVQIPASFLYAYTSFEDWSRGIMYVKSKYEPRSYSHFILQNESVCNDHIQWSLLFDKTVKAFNTSWWRIT